MKTQKQVKKLLEKGELVKTVAYRDGDPALPEHTTGTLTHELRTKMGCLYARRGFIYPIGRPNEAEAIMLPAGVNPYDCSEDADDLLDAAIQQHPKFGGFCLKTELGKNDVTIGGESLFDLVDVDGIACGLEDAIDVVSVNTGSGTRATFSGIRLAKVSSIDRTLGVPEGFSARSLALYRTGKARYVLVETSRAHMSMGPKQHSISVWSSIREIKESSKDPMTTWLLGGVGA